MLVFDDETGANRHTALRRYGYSLKGKPATTDTLLVRGKRYSAIGAISMDGVVEVHITDHSVDGEVYLLKRNCYPSCYRLMVSIEEVWW